MEQLSPTAYVILGFVRNEPRSGYEIKALVDNSTRFFWAASYGQIYPELKRLAEIGLIVGSDSPTGGRRRTVYEITADGEEELRAWLRQPPQAFEMRDEGLLKLFFANALPRGEAGQGVEHQLLLCSASSAATRICSSTRLHQSTNHSVYSMPQRRTTSV